jgi:hypothetical protein
LRPPMHTRDGLWKKLGVLAVKFTSTLASSGNISKCDGVFFCQDSIIIFFLSR